MYLHTYKEEGRWQQKARQGRKRMITDAMGQFLLQKPQTTLKEYQEKLEAEFCFCGWTKRNRGRSEIGERAVSIVAIY